MGDGNECFEAPTEYGVIGQVAGSEVDAIVVWDTEAPCGGDGSYYVHYAADGLVDVFEPMTAGTGPLVHTYVAVMFPNTILPLPENTTGCYSFDSSLASRKCIKQWDVARYGSHCPGGKTGLGILACNHSLGWSVLFCCTLMDTTHSFSSFGASQNRVLHCIIYNKCGRQITKFRVCLYNMSKFSLFGTAQRNI